MRRWLAFPRSPECANAPTARRPAPDSARPDRSSGESASRWRVPLRRRNSSINSTANHRANQPRFSFRETLRRLQPRPEAATRHRQPCTPARARRQVSPRSSRATRYSPPARLASRRSAGRRERRPGLPRSRECRAGASRCRETDHETCLIRKQGSRRRAGQTCNARKGRLYRRSLPSGRHANADGPEIRA